MNNQYSQLKFSINWQEAVA